MDWKNRIEKINKADELVDFARKIYNNKRIDLLKKASKLYKEANLSLLSEKIEKEAHDWEIWFN